MRASIAFLVFCGFAVGLSTPFASPQNLGDVARASREKRLKTMQERSVRIWTNDNLPKRPPSEGPTAAAGMSAAPPAQPQQATAASPPGGATTPAEDKKKSREFWQQEFNAARQKLAADQDQQQLAEDELNLLQIQQARELSPDRQPELDAQVKAKTADVEAKRAQTAKAKKEIEDLEKEFKESGAPPDWGKSE